MNRTLAIYFVLFTVMLDAVGIGLIMPVMPDLIIELGGENLSQAALWGGVLSASFAVMQFLFGPMLGNISDRFGRRPVLLLSLTVMSLDYIIMGFAGAMWVLLIGRILGGITAANHATASAVIADISEPDQKAANFGLLGAAFGVGFVLGPFLGGVLSEFGPRAPFFVAAFLAAANTVFGFFVLPETVTDETRRPFTLARANPFGAFRQVGRLPGLTRLLLVFFFYHVAFFVYPSVWSYFGQERFGWDARMVGMSLAAFGLSMAVAQGWLIRLIIPRLGEHRTTQIGLAMNLLQFTLLAFVSNGILVFFFLPITALGAMAGPAMQGIMSRSVSDDAQGELQGVLTSVGAVGTIVAPLLMTSIFSVFTRENAPLYFPGAPFLLSVVLVAIAFVLFRGRKRLI